MEVPGLGVESELQPLTYATATPDLSPICNLRCSFWEHQILNSLNEARDGTCILIDTDGLSLG